MRVRDVPRDRVRKGTEGATSHAWLTLDGRPFFEAVHVDPLGGASMAPARGLEPRLAPRRRIAVQPRAVS